MLVPPGLASWLVMRYADLEPYRRSAFGRYIAQYMTRAMEAVRLAGFIAMAVGAWYRSALAIVLGVAAVLVGWLCRFFGVVKVRAHTPNSCPFFVVPCRAPGRNLLGR